MADVVNYVVDQYADNYLTADWTDSNGVSLIQTGWTAKMQIRTAPGGTVIQTYTDSDYITIDTTKGAVSVHFPNSQTSVWTWTAAVYDLQIITNDSTPIKYRLIEGTIVLNPGVTQ